jgi:hypothetical protein
VGVIFSIKFAEMTTFASFRVLLHAQLHRNVTDGFISSPKKGTHAEDFFGPK